MHTPRTRREAFRTRLEHVMDTRSAGLAAWLMRRTGGRIGTLWHRQVLVLTTRGRRSGRPRTVPLQYFTDGNDMIVVAANSGLDVAPAWFLNLAAEPSASVEVAGRTLAVQAAPLTPEQTVAFWPRVLDVAPDYARYLRRTDRRIPMVRLVVVPGASPRPVA